MSNSSPTRHPIAWVPSVYFAMGMPFVTLSLVSVIMLADLGIEASQITFWTSLLILPYSLKFLWSPLLEIYGTKKTFVTITQAISGIAFGLIAFSLPLPSWFALTIALMAVVGLSGATHDIATDGIYLAALDKKTQAAYIGWQGAFYNIAKVLANGALVYLAGSLMQSFQASDPATAPIYAWMIIFGIISALLILLSIYHYFMLPNPQRASQSKSFGESMRELLSVFRDFFKKPNIWLYIAFIIVYRLTEGFAIKMVPLFLKDSLANGGLELSNESIGLIYGTLGTIAFIVGSILGGYFISRFGLKRVLLSLVCIFNLPFAIYLALAIYQPENIYLIAASLIGEYFCYGFGFVGLTLFMMQQVASGKHEMAHYAFASAIMNFGFMIPGMLAGYVFELVGYTTFFLISLLVAIPALIIASVIPFNHQEQTKDAKA